MPKLIPLKTIKKIKSLRQKGYSLPEIKREVGVSHGSVYRHIKGVEIQPEYKQIWHSKRGGSLKRMKLAEEKAKKMANESIDKLSEKEKIIFLSALYWGEGSKGDFGLTNSDPDLIRVFILGLKNVFNINEKRLRISIRIYKDLNKDKCLIFWSNITGVPVESFVSINILEGKKNGKLSYGMCRVRVTKGADMLKYTKALKSRITSLF